MKILHTDKSIFDIATGMNVAVCITTNGIVKRDGCAVMGAGIAKDCVELFPGISKTLGDKIKESGNKVHRLGIYTRNLKTGMLIYQILSFPTKHHWKDNSDINLIVKSCKEIIELADLYEYPKIYLTPPGCKNGHLDWESQVRPVIEPMLDDRFIVVVRDF